MAMAGYVPARDDPDFADHLFWFHWSNGTFMTTLMMQLVLQGGAGNPGAGSSKSGVGVAGRW